MNEMSITSSIQSDHVRIKLEELDQKKPQKNILPGQKIVRKIQVSNEGADAYIRVKVSSHETIWGLNKEWELYEDGYFYYQKILGKEERVVFMEGFQIPVDNAEENKELSILIAAEAIQAKNFIPDFAAESPWGQVRVEETHSVSIPDYEKQFLIECQSDHNSKISVNDDFLTDISSLMPGDDCTGEIILENKNKIDVNFYFWSEILMDTVLFDELKVQIVSEVEGSVKTIYEGNLENLAAKEKVLLGKIPNGKTGKIYVRIYMPKELDNFYAAQKGQIKWVFATDISPFVKAAETIDNHKLGILYMLTGISLGVIAFSLYMKEGTINEKRH